MKIVAYGLFIVGFSAALAAADSTFPATPVVSKNDPKWEWGEFSFLGGQFDSHPNINVMIVTELTNVGRSLPEASPAHPVYYSGADGGRTLGGDPIAGEHPPRPAELASLMVKSLRDGGYLPASAGHPPTIYIYYNWGSFNRLRDERTGRGWDYLSYVNFMERAALVGGTKFAKDLDEARTFHYVDEFKGSNARNSYLVSLAESDLYFLVATACDYRAAVNGNAVILWQTRLSSEARVVSMDESLPQLVMSAASYIGHETNGPVRLNRPAVREGEVDVGVPFEVRDDRQADAPNPFPRTRSFLPAIPSPADN
jgi:hypothetical protein